MNKILKIVLIVLLSISALLTLLFYAGGDVSGQPRFTNIFIIWAVVLTGLAIGLTVIFPVIQMITNPKNAKKGLLGVLSLVCRLHWSC